jgi:hypothetical protein
MAMIASMPAGAMAAANSEPSPEESASPLTPRAPSSAASDHSSSAPWNYSMDTTVPFAWLDARSGQNLTPNLRNRQGQVDKDDGFTSIALPWSFNYYNVDYTTLYVGANGYLGFDPGSSYDIANPTGFPSSHFASQKLVAPFWTDLLFEARGGIYAKSVGSPERLVVEYYDATCFCAVDKLRIGTFELVLFRDGTLYFQFLEMRNSASSSNLTGLNDGDGKHYTICSATTSCGVVNGTANFTIGFYRPASLSVLPKSFSPAQADQGTDNVSTLGLDMAASQGSISVIGVDAHLDGNLSLPHQSHISELSAWHDKDRSGNVTQGDTFLASTIFVAGLARLGGFSLRVGTSGGMLLFAVNLTPVARAQRVFGVAVLAAADVKTNGQSVGANGFPARSGLTEILDAVPDGLHAQSANQAPLDVEKGRVNVVMLALVMNATSDWVYLEHLNLSLAGNASSTDVRWVGVIYDKDRSGGYSTGDVPLRYKPQTNGSVNFTSLGFRVEEPLKEILLLAVNVSSAAVEGRTIGLCASAAGTFVRAPDLLASFTGGCSTNATIVGDRAPPEVQAIQISPQPPAKAERLTFTVTFSEVMDAAAAPRVTFGTAAPWTQNSVSGTFVSGADWQGLFDVTTATGDGSNMVRVADGKDLSGNQMGEDLNTSFVIDTVVPESRVLDLPPESPTRVLSLDVWNNESGSGLARIELFYQVNSGPWLSHGNFTSSPIGFTAPRDGYFGFFSVAEDNASNLEARPGVPDAFTSIDALPPESRAHSLPAYTLSRIFPVPFTASDNGTGVKHVELFYRVQGGVWSRHPGEHTASPISFEAQSDGSVEFYTVGVDRAGHREPPPSAADSSTVVDTAPPSYTVVSPRAGDILIDGSSARAEWVPRDNVGMAPGTKVELSLDLGGNWSDLGSSPGESLLFTVPAVDSQDSMLRVSGSDLAGNSGSGVSGVFTIASRLPASSLGALGKYSTQRTLNMSYTTMHPKGLAIVELKVYGRAAGGAWTELASDKDGDRRVQVSVPVDGAWEFYSQAVDANGDREPVPRLPDAKTAVDTVPPKVLQASPSGEWSGGVANVSVKFSEPMNSTSVARAFLVTVSGPPPAGVFEWSASNDSFIWRPTGPLPATVEFRINTTARDLAGNRMLEEHSWRLGPPSPPDPWPVLALVALLIAAVALLLLLLHRRSRMRCATCRKPITQGEQCRDCREKEDLKEKGKLEDGVMVVEPVPPGPNADFGEPEQAEAREEPGEGQGEEPRAFPRPVVAAEPAEAEVGAREAAEALMAAEGPASEAPLEGREGESQAEARPLAAPRPVSKAAVVSARPRARAPEPSFVPESPPAPARPEVRMRRDQNLGAPHPDRNAPPAAAVSELDRRPPGRVAVAPVVKTPQAPRPPPSMVGPREEKEEEPKAADDQKALSAKERLERIRKMREARGGK